MYALTKVVRAFTRTLVKVEGRFLIITACKYCGEAQIAAPVDAVIDHWEDEHRCKEVALLSAQA